MARSIVILVALSVLASGCVVDIPIEKETKVFTIEGNATLAAARTRIFGEIVRPYKVTKTIDKRDLSTVRLVRFVLEVTEDSEGPGDQDDLAFVESAVLLIESNDPTAGLPVLEIAWYDLPGEPEEARARWSSTWPRASNSSPTSARDSASPRSARTSSRRTTSPSSDAPTSMGSTWSFESHECRGSPRAVK
jgi:hypothetical protein